jgi:A/G-specific adenine glycosylase
MTIPRDKPARVRRVAEAQPSLTSTPTAQSELLAWYAAVGRDLPWRKTRDPYRILVSEVMLQQTQVDRVIPFYERFLAAFPDEQALAAAKREAIHRAWKGLGYPSRVERLQAACQAVLQRGSWPDTPEGLRELPGIGPYTGGSVSVFAFARPVAVVDTNVARVYARRDGLAMPLDREALWEHAAREVDRGDPIAYTNALMDLGATVCTARTTRCTVCPWAGRCRTLGDETYLAASSNPLKVASTKVSYGVEIADRSLPRLHIVLALVHHEGRYLVARRRADRHQGGFWEIPGGKREKGEDDRVAIARELSEETGLELLAARPLVQWNFAYPDRYLTFHAYRCRVFNPEAAQALDSDEIRWVTPAELVELAFPPANDALVQRLRRYHRLGAAKTEPGS